MANYNECITSNYFKVKNTDKFKEVLNDNEIECFFEYDEIEDKFCVATYDGLFMYVLTDNTSGDEDGYEVTEDDIYEIIKSHLDTDEVCEIGMVGHEKLRYLTSYTVFITPYEIKTYDNFELANDRFNIEKCIYKDGYLYIEIS